MLSMKDRLSHPSGTLEEEFAREETDQAVCLARISHRAVCCAATLSDRVLLEGLDEYRYCSQQTAR